MIIRRARPGSPTNGIQFQPLLFPPFRYVSLKPSDNFIQVANEPLPAVARTPVGRFLVRTLLISAAGLLECNGVTCLELSMKAGHAIVPQLIVTRW